MGRELGGAWRLSVYQIEDNETWTNMSTTYTQYGNITYLGCYADSSRRVFSDGPVLLDTVAQNAFVEEAMRTAKRRQVRRFGIEARREAYFPQIQTLSRYKKR
jgi:hypothetical protein